MGQRKTSIVFAHMKINSHVVCVTFVNNSVNKKSEVRGSPIIQNFLKVLFTKRFSEENICMKEAFALIIYYMARKLKTLLRLHIIGQYVQDSAVACIYFWPQFNLSKTDANSLCESNIKINYLGSDSGTDLLTNHQI